MRGYAGAGEVVGHGAEEDGEFGDWGLGGEGECLVDLGAAI